MIQRVKNFLGKIKLLRSFKVRIFLIIMLAGSIPCIILRYGILETYTERAVNLKTSDIQTQGRILANHLLTYN